MYRLDFDEEWPKYFKKLDKETKERTAKKIKKILQQPQKRHLKKGMRYFVEEVGQHRLIYRIFKEDKEVRFYFIGKHKKYEKWYKKFF